jgi:hypothetical protein
MSPSPMIHRYAASRAARVLLAIVFLAGSVVLDAAVGAGALATPTRAAETDLTLVTSATYDVQPAQRRVRVVVDVTASNRKRDTVTKRFFFDRAFLAVQPGTKGFTVVSPTRAKVSVARKTKQYTLLRIHFGQRLFGGKSAKIQLRFDLPDPGGAPTRPIRIGDSLVAFPVWAYASDGAKGSQVAVSFPAGFDVTVETGEIAQRVTTADGRTILRTGPLARPTTFFAYVVADRPGAYLDTPLTVAIDGASVPLVLRAWVDDPPWTKRVGDLFQRGMPVMADAIGRPWSWVQPVVVAEGASRSEDADAGLFDPATGRIEIAYYADAFVVLHEAAHGWFNGRLLADRWANEAFASYYAERALNELELKAPVDTLTDELLAVRIPLNAWSVGAETDPLVVDYGYAAALELARRIGERAGDDVLREVWRDATTGVPGYQPTAAPGYRAPTELTEEPPDWRGLLDLLEDRSGERFDDLWREWVVRPDEEALLDARIAARESYTRTVALADGWAIPQAARDALRAWQFEAAEAILADTRTVIAQREALELAAERSDLMLPPRFRQLFETEADLAGASEEAVRQLAVIDALDAAHGLRPEGDDPLVSLGLIGVDPAASLAQARVAFSDGRLEDALSGAAVASIDWRGAWNEGRRRLLVIVALVATTMVLGSSAVGWMRRRRLHPASSVPTG